MKGAEWVTASGNALLVRLRRLVRDGGAYRRLGEIWVEGEHLCAAAAARGHPASIAVVSDKGWQLLARRQLALHAERIVCVPDALFAGLSALESVPDIGFVLAMPPPLPVDPLLPTVVLDRLQDAGNVGSILRTASALGVPQVLALKGTAALWSGKVLRAGMGAHFALRLVEGLGEPELLGLGLQTVVTSSHAEQSLPDAALPQPCAWVFGHEGQGVSPAIESTSRLQVRIPQPGGEESLNVAAAAAICLYAGSLVRPRQ